MTVVVGYHGTSLASSHSILTDGFRASINEYDWLGDGVYFFEGNPTRALGWAKKRHGDQAAVIKATISLQDCMDLNDPEWFAVFADTYNGILIRHKEFDLALPKQTGGAHRLDRLIINIVVRLLQDDGRRIASVRGVFQEGRPAFPGSALFDLSHVQIAVRDTSAILMTNTVEERT